MPILHTLFPSPPSRFKTHATMPRPYELVLNFRPKVSKGKQPQRSRKGCFNCRKMKKKCDEVQPCCGTCDQKCIPCVWPRGKESMPKDYKIPPPDQEKMKRRKAMYATTRDIQPKETPPPPLPTSTTRATLSASMGDLPSDRSTSTPNVTTLSVAKERYHSTDLMALDLHSKGKITPLDDSPTTENPPLDVPQDPFGPLPDVHEISEDPVDLFSQEEILPLWAPIATSKTETFITACAVGLISACAPQVTHPLLHASSTWTPFVKVHPVMEVVAEACGCAFMSWKRPELTPLAEQKYDTAFNTLFTYINGAPVEKKDQLWLGAALQLLSVASKEVWSFRDPRRIENLRGSYALIKARLENGGSPDRYAQGSIQEITDTSSSESPSSPQSPPQQRYENGFVSADYMNDNRRMEVENSLIRNEQAKDLASRFERGWIEAFLYQYGMLLLIDDVDKLGFPTPFEVFSLVRGRLKRPLMNCDVAWMNHPVFGASFDAFEMACKASYLMRHLDHENTFAAANTLFDAVLSYQLPVIPAKMRLSPEKYANVRDSVLMSEVMLRAVKILLRKIINLRLDESETAVQRDLDAALGRLQEITYGSQVMGISSWPLLILGLVCKTQQQRDIVIGGCFQYAEVIQARYIYTVIDTLEIAWGMRGCGEGTARGLDVLLDRNVMEKLIL